MARRLQRKRQSCTKVCKEPCDTGGTECSLWASDPPKVANKMAPLTGGDHVGKTGRYGIISRAAEKI